jgi:hypothetical protein
MSPPAIFSAAQEPSGGRTTRPNPLKFPSRLCENELPQVLLSLLADAERDAPSPRMPTQANGRRLQRFDKDNIGHVLRDREFPATPVPLLGKD